MPVEIIQWRATIGGFRYSVQQLHKTTLQVAIFFQIFMLYWCCLNFIAISTLILPLAILINFLSMHYVKSQPNVLQTFSRLYSLSMIVIYNTIEHSKKIPSNSYCVIKATLFNYAYIYPVSGLMVCYKNYTQSVSKRILLSGDVETNPGPDTLNFCCWNLNSIATHNFQRVSLMEAYNSVYNYDLIGIVETHLDSTIDEDRLALGGYTFFKSNHPHNVKRGGVGLYVKDTLPSRERSDLVTLSECIVFEIQANRKKYFFAIIYRSPSQNQIEFDDFTLNFELLISKLAAENPFCVVVSGDFNCRSSQWWDNEIENNEGKRFEPLTSDLGLYQLISEPTHLMGDSKSCIDLIFTDQPNLFIETGVHSSLQEQCHHQIIYGKLAVSNLAPPPYSRRFWYYDKADGVGFKKSVEMYKWEEHLQSKSCPNEQVQLLNEVLLNISSNFIPNNVKTIRPRQAPWITEGVRNFIQKKIACIRNI